MIKIPQVFFWKFYSREKLTSTKTFSFVISTKECICNSQFYGLVTPTVHSSALSLKNPKLREQLFSGKKSSPTHESPFNFKNWSGKSDEFEKLVGEKWLIFEKRLNFSPTFFSPIRFTIMLKLKNGKIVTSDRFYLLRKLIMSKVSGLRLINLCLQEIK